MADLTGYQSMLLGAQAAGIGANLYASYQNKKMAQYGYEVEKGEVALRKSQEELSFAEANLASLQELQEVMATQRAIMGARGQNPGVGSALAVGEKSLRAQSSDQRARELTKNFRQAQLDSMSRLLNIKKAGARAQFGASLIEGGLSTLNLNTTIGEYIQKNKQTLKPLKNDINTNIGPFKNKNPYQGTYQIKGRING